MMMYLHVLLIEITSEYQHSVHKVGNPREDEGIN